MEWSNRSKVDNNVARGRSGNRFLLSGARYEKLIRYCDKDILTTERVWNIFHGGNYLLPYLPYYMSGWSKIVILRRSIK